MRSVDEIRNDCVNGDEATAVGNWIPNRQPTAAAATSQGSCHAKLEKRAVRAPCGAPDGQEVSSGQLLGKHIGKVLK